MAKESQVKFDELLRSKEATEEEFSRLKEEALLKEKRVKLQKIAAYLKSSSQIKLGNALTSLRKFNQISKESEKIK